MTVYYKIWKILLQNATAILLRNATSLKCVKFFITKWTVVLENATVITKCDVYYKLG